MLQKKDSASKRQRTSDSQTNATSSGLTPFKTPTIVLDPQEPFKTVPIRRTVIESSIDDSSLKKQAAFLSLLVQIHSLRETVTSVDTDDDCALLNGLKLLYQGLLAPQDKDAEATTFGLCSNPFAGLFPKLAETAKPKEILNQIVSELETDNKKLARSLNSTLKTLEICINCGH